jgi:hypothetical protein
MSIQIPNRAHTKTNKNFVRAPNSGLPRDFAALNILRQFPSLVYGEWDDTEPTSDEWQAYVANVLFGVWDDNEPTGTPTPSDEPVYTLWDDTETTT